MSQFDKRNLSMMMDLYEMTMANGYFLDQNTSRKVTFDTNVLVVPAIQLD